MKRFRNKFSLETVSKKKNDKINKEEDRAFNPIFYFDRP